MTSPPLAKLSTQTSKLRFVKTVILDERISYLHLHLAVKVRLINRNQQNKADTKELFSKRQNGKMPIFNCLCGVKILIVSDLTAMSKAIKNHIIEHKKLTGQDLTEEILTQEILNFIIGSINEV